MGYSKCPELRAESASWDQRAGPSLAAHQFTWGGKDCSALPNPDVLVEYTHFHFECMFPSGLLTRLQPPQSEIGNRSVWLQSDRTPRIPHQILAAACLFQHQHPTVPSEKGRIPQAQRKGFSGRFLDGRGLDILCMMETVFSSIPLGGEA